MRLSRPRLTTAALATAALALTGCSSDQDSASGPVLTTMETSSADATTAATSAQPTTSAPKSADEKDEKENEENGSAAEDDTKSDNAKPKDDRTNVTAGTVCGQVTSLGDGSPLSIVAMTDGVDCDEAMAVFSDYMSDSPSGITPQGSGAFWTAPNGWTCGGSNYLFPGDEDQKFNKYPSCGPDSNEHLVVAVDPERVSELPV